MAAQKADVNIISGASVSPVLPFRTDDWTTSSQTEVIQPGNPVTQDNGNYVEIVANGGPVNSTGLFVGIAQNTSTETSTAEGTVDVAVVVPFVTKMRAKATTASNIATDAALKAVLLDAITFDNTSNVITIDEDEGDDPNEHGLVVVDGDINKGTLDFYAKPLACAFGNNV